MRPDSGDGWSCLLSFGVAVFVDDALFDFFEGDYFVVLLFFFFLQSRVVLVEIVLNPFLFVENELWVVKVVSEFSKFSFDLQLSFGVRVYLKQVNELAEFSLVHPLNEVLADQSLEELTIERMSLYPLSVR